MCHIQFGAKTSDPNLPFGAPLIHPLNNVCQVINKAFPGNYNDSKKIVKTSKTPREAWNASTISLRRVKVKKFFCVCCQLNSELED